MSPPTSANCRCPYVAGTACRVASWTNCTRRLVKNGPELTKRASGRSCTKVAKAASISRMLLALKTWICSPIAGAAASTSLNVVSDAITGLRSTARRAAPGTSSRKSANRFAVNSVVKKFIPVKLPPGLARLTTRPSLTGSSPVMKTMGIVAVAAFAANAEAVPTNRGDHGDLSAHQVSCQCRQPFNLILGPAILDRNILALDIARFIKALAKSRQNVFETFGRRAAEDPYDWHRSAFRASR